MIIVFVYVGTWIGFMSEFAWNFQKWADHFELEIRSEKMTTDQFCKWIAVRITLWPAYIRILLNF